jgi:hypothetical protein
MAHLIYSNVKNECDLASTSPFAFSPRTGAKWRFGKYEIRSDVLVFSVVTECTVMSESSISKKNSASIFSLMTEIAFISES